jgi:hypothetical protein
MTLVTTQSARTNKARAEKLSGDRGVAAISMGWGSLRL